MSKNAEKLRETAEKVKRCKEPSSYSIDFIYDELIYPILQAAARDGQFSYVTSKWSFVNLLPDDINVLEVLRYIQEEKNIRVHNHGDTISFFW